MTTYARITLKGRRPFLLQITQETNVLLCGIEIKADGDEVVRRVKGQTIDVTRHIISKDMIAKRTPMVMNNTFGLLERQK